MEDFDINKGYRSDGQFCFLKVFDLCEKGDKCVCDNPTVFTEETEQHAKYYELLAEEFESIEND